VRRYHTDIRKACTGPVGAGNDRLPREVPADAVPGEMARLFEVN